MDAVAMVMLLERPSLTSWRSPRGHYNDLAACHAQELLNYYSVAGNLLGAKEIATSAANPYNSLLEFLYFLERPF